MTQILINTGLHANDKSGDSLKVAFTKVNTNFSELYARAAAETGDLVFNGTTITSTGSLTLTPDPNNTQNSLRIRDTYVQGNKTIVETVDNTVSSLYIGGVDNFLFVDKFGAVGMQARPGSGMPVVLQGASSPIVNNGKPIANIELGNPVVVTVVGHGLANNDKVFIDGLTSTIELNAQSYYVYVLDVDRFEIYFDTDLMAPIDGTAFTPYVDPDTGYITSAKEGGDIFIAAGGNHIGPQVGDSGVVNIYGQNVLTTADYTGNIAASLYAQLQWTPDLTTYDPISSAGQITNWIYADAGGVHIELHDNVNDPGYNYEWHFTNDGILNLAVFGDNPISLIQAPASIQLNANGKLWSFDTDGNITLPDGGDIRDVHGSTVLGGGGSVDLSNYQSDSPVNINSTAGLTLLYNGVTGIEVVDSNLRIYANNGFMSWDGSNLKIPYNGDIKRDDGFGHYNSVLGGGSSNQLINNGVSVTLDNYGNLHMDVPGASIVAAPDSYTGIKTHDGKSFVYVNSDGFTVNTNYGLINQHSWAFGTDGTLTFPNGEHFVAGGITNAPSQSLNFAAGDNQIGLIPNDATGITPGVLISTSQTEGILNEWRFGTDGTTAFPNNTIASPVVTPESGGIFNGIQNYITLSSGGPPYWNYEFDGADPILTEWLGGACAQIWPVGHPEQAVNFVGCGFNPGTNIWTITFSSPLAAGPYTGTWTDYTPPIYNDIVLVSGDKNWTFSKDGKLEIPSALESTSNTLYINYNSGHDVQVGSGSGRTILNTSRVQVLSTPPTSSKGSAGDLQGCIAFDSNYIYYCSAPYDGTTDIWHRVVWTSNSW